MGPAAWLAAKFGGIGVKLALIGGAIAGFFLWLASVKRGARKEGAAQEQARIGAAWSEHETKVVQDVERGRTDGPAGARERLRRDAGGDGA